jgi:hypothetical protein
VDRLELERDEQDLDGLRLVALGRIPRCARCELYRSLVTIHSGSFDPRGGLPASPPGCTHQVCAPLASRMSQAARLLAS